MWLETYIQCDCEQEEEYFANSGLENCLDCIEIKELKIFRDANYKFGNLNQNKRLLSRKVKEFRYLLGKKS